MLAAAPAVQFSQIECPIKAHFLSHIPGQVSHACQAAVKEVLSCLLHMPQLLPKLRTFAHFPQ